MSALAAAALLTGLVKDASSDDACDNGYVKLTAHTRAIIGFS